MSSGILSELYQTPESPCKIRQNVFEIWYDLFSYSKNLNGNWFYSQEIFNNHIAPTAMEHPEYFAECVEEMVKKSGIKLKYRYPYLKAIRLLKRLKNKSFEAEIVKRALVDMFKAGLQEPRYAEKAIRLSGMPVSA